MSIIDAPVQDLPVAPVATAPPKDKRFAVLAALYALLVVAAVGYVYVSHVRRQGETNAPHLMEDLVAGTVNGDPITLGELNRALLVSNGSPMLRQLMQQKVVFQEAKKDGIKLDDQDSLLQLDDLNKKARDPIVFRELDRQLRSRLLLRKIMLRDVPESRKQHLYDVFHDVLAQYELFDIAVANQADAKTVAAALKKGGDFAKLVDTWSKDNRSKQDGGRLGFVRLDQIEDALGKPAADAVRKLKTGDVSAPLQTRHGVLILKVGKIRTTYDDLKSSIEDLLTNATRNATMYHLVTEAKMESPLWEPAGAHPSAMKTLPVDSGKSTYAVPSAAPGKKSSIFAAPSAAPSGGGSIFAPLPSSAPKPGKSEEPIFAAPSSVPHASKSDDPIFAPPSAPSSDKTDEPIFAPPH